MTTGTKVWDNRQVYSGDCGTTLVGSYLQKTWSGADDPVIHKAENPFTMELWEEFITPITWCKTATPASIRSGTWKSCFGGIAFEPLAFDSNDLAKLINKLGDKIRGHEFNAAVSIGAEGKDALRQIAGASKAMYNGMRMLKKGNIDGALRYLGLKPAVAKEVGYHKTLSGKVLATQLGWLPLMGDVDDAYGALRRLSDPPLTGKFTVGIRKLGSVTLADGSPARNSENYLSRRLTWILSESEQLGVVDSLHVSNPWDMANLAWNATFLSFIADWFIPIGSYLDARSVVSGLEGRGYQTTLLRSKGSSILGPYLGGARTIKSGTYFSKHVTVNREVINSLSGYVPLPRFKDFSKIPSWKRALTAVTLATQMFL